MSPRKDGFTVQNALGTSAQRIYKEVVFLFHLDAGPSISLV